jgi:hypothetical protein
MSDEEPVPPMSCSPPSPRELLAQHGTPVVDAMRYWLSGDASVPSLVEFFDRFGNQYRDHLRTMFDPQLGSLSFETRAVITRSMNFMAIHMERDLFIDEFSFAVPTREALDCLAQYSPLLEIGAGSGAWAKLLAMRGADIIATDPALESYRTFVAKEDESNVFRRWERLYHPILPLQGKTAVRRWPKRNVFCCWPSLGDAWLRQAARAMLPGRVLLVVREEATADERTWDYVEYAFKPIAIGAGGDGWVDNSIELPNWHFLHDHLEVWQKKTYRELEATPPPVKDEHAEEERDRRRHATTGELLDEIEDLLDRKS